MKEYDYNKLIELGFCWGNHQVRYKTSARTITCYLTCFINPSQKMIKDVRQSLIKYLDEKPNAKKFKLPELISWCGCEPQCTEFNKLRYDRATK